MKWKFLEILKMFFFFTLFGGIFYVLEYGTTWDNPGKFLKPILLSGFTVTMLFQQKLRRYIFIFSIICLLLMAVMSVFNWSDLSNNIGSFGFSLLVVTVFLYLPQIIKKGHVEKF